MIKNSELSRVARLLNEFLMSYDWVQKPHTFFFFFLELLWILRVSCSVNEFRGIFQVFGNFSRRKVFKNIFYARLLIHDDFFFCSNETLGRNGCEIALG